MMWLRSDSNWGGSMKAWPSSSGDSSQSQPAWLWVAASSKMASGIRP